MIVGKRGATTSALCVPDNCRGKKVDFAAAADGVLKIRARRAGRAHAPMRVQSNQRDLCRGSAAAGGNFDGAANHRLACFLRRVSRAHQLDDQDAPAGADDFFAHARARGGSRGIVNVQPRAD